MKNMIICLLISSVFSSLALYNNYIGSGLPIVNRSYSSDLVMTTLGNNNSQTFDQLLLQTILDSLNILICVFFVIYWEIFSKRIIE